jgi:hypothetical protein
VSSGSLRVRLLKVDDVLGGSLDDQKSLSSDSSESSPVLFLRASEVLVVVSLNLFD